MRIFSLFGHFSLSSYATIRGPNIGNQIGRKQRQESNQTTTIKQAAALLAKYKIPLKINTVVTSENWQEDMSDHIEELAPVRWKVFQCLLIGGENAGENALRNAENLVITNAQFEHFISNHKSKSRKHPPVPESNDAMRNSYFILDEYMRFLNNQNGEKTPSKSILDVGVHAALDESGFDEQTFLARGGIYKWSKKFTPDSKVVLDW